MVPSNLVGTGARYLAGHGRFVELASDARDDQAVGAVHPWSLRDLVAHLVGVSADLVEGNTDDWAQPDWTDAQVRSRAGRPRAELLDEWDRLMPRVVRILDDVETVGLDDDFERMPIVDLIGHEHDLAEALGVPRSIEPEDWEIVGLHRRLMLDDLVSDAGLPPLRVRTVEGDDWLVGVSGQQPAADAEVQSNGVTLPRQELWRSLMGRRSREAVLSYAWSVDPLTYLDVWVSPSFGWPDDG